MIHEDNDMLDRSETSEGTTMPAGDDRIAELEREIAEWKDQYVRSKAETENIRRRSTLREQELISYASEHLITKMLPVLDDLHAAVEAARTSTDAEAVRAGVEMIYNKAVRIFEEAGVRTIDAGIGQPFNVEVHEALMHMPNDVHPEGAVIQEVQRGYKLHDKVIRHTKVITSAGKDA